MGLFAVMSVGRASSWRGNASKTLATPEPSPTLLAALRAKQVTPSPAKVKRPAALPVDPKPKAIKARTKTSKPKNEGVRKKTPTAAAPSPQAQKRKSRWRDDSTDNLWTPKPNSKNAIHEEVVYSVPADQIYEGFTSRVIEQVDLNGRKRMTTAAEKAQLAASKEAAVAAPKKSKPKPRSSSPRASRPATPKKSKEPKVPTEPK